MKPCIIWGQRLGRAECPYLRRWVANLGPFSLRLHHWMASDDHRNFHDHPWAFLTVVIRGSYVDVTERGRELIPPFSPRLRPALHRHTVEVPPSGCWSILLTGPEVRKWGFWVAGKFRKANKYFLMYGHHPCNPSPTSPG